MREVKKAKKGAKAAKKAVADGEGAGGDDREPEDIVKPLTDGQVKKFTKATEKLAPLILELTESVAKAKAPEFKDFILKFQIDKAEVVFNKLDKASKDLALWLAGSAPQQAAKDMAKNIADLLKDGFAATEKLNDVIGDAVEARGDRSF